MKNIFMVPLLLSLTIVNLHAKKTCSQFKTWKEANTYFKAKKSGYKSLDRNHDGKPCENLWKKLISKEKKKTHIKIYQYGSPVGQGRSFSSMSACEKERVKLTKSHIGTNYTYKCESN